MILIFIILHFYSANQYNKYSQTEFNNRSLFSCYQLQRFQDLQLKSDQKEETLLNRIDIQIKNMESTQIIRRTERPKTSRPNRYVNIKIKDKIEQNDQKIYRILDQAKPYLKHKEWAFNFEKQFAKSGISNFLNILDLILIQSLSFHFCKCPTILKQLDEISFPRLKSLSLPGNKINSIEALQKINFPNLKFLQLRQSNIVHAKSLVKLNCDQLDFLEISQSQIIQINFIWQKTKFAQHLINMMTYNFKYLQLDNQIIKKDFSKINHFWITSCHGMLQKQCSFLKKIIVKKHKDIPLLHQRIRIFSKIYSID